ncbi:hypothetical protein [Haladaptatus sp. DFWS20]|uniref:hypothetical protein n=1 Tax=Haladaptatus sp. DFWS20 TaxID=3403467 RepID=UPI003EBF33A2
MLERLLVAFGLIEIFAPDKLVERSESVAFENMGDCTLKSWALSAVRVEGVTFVVLGLRGRSSTFRRWLGLLGLPALLMPRQYLAFSTNIAYENAAECEWKPWVVPLTRLLGLVYVLISLREVGSRSE